MPQCPTTIRVVDTFVVEPHKETPCRRTCATTRLFPATDPPTLTEKESLEGPDRWIRAPSPRPLPGPSRPPLDPTANPEIRPTGSEPQTDVIRSTPVPGCVLRPQLLASCMTYFLPMHRLGAPVCSSSFLLVPSHSFLSRDLHFACFDIEIYACSLRGFVWCVVPFRQSPKPVSSTIRRVSPTPDCINNKTRQ